MTNPIKSIAVLPILMPIEIQNLSQIYYLLMKLCLSRKNRSRTRGTAIRRFLMSLYKVEMHLALFSLRTESDNPDATCELSP